MQQITVTTTVASLPLGGNATPILQNLGPGMVYFGPTFSLTAGNGFKLPPGVGYEFPQSLRAMSSWDVVYVISDSTADLRYGSVG
jgi:hypothetical protein